MSQARKHHADAAAYEQLLYGIRGLEDRVEYMYPEMTPHERRRIFKMAVVSMRQAAKQVISRMASAGYDFGPPYDLFEDSESSLDKVA